MATAVSAGLTPREGRRFGFTVGGAFLTLAAVGRWRGLFVTPAVMGAVGAALVSAGALLPTRLGLIERAWSAFGHALSAVTTPIVMAVLYFGVITPAGLLRRAFAGNLLIHKSREGTYFKPRPSGARRSKDLRRQF